MQYDPETYINNCVRNFDRVFVKLDEYLHNPTKENIHHMRTSLRRLEATYRSSPKRIQKKKSIKTFVQRGKKLFRINSRIRDIDIIIEKLTIEGKMSQRERELIENPLRQERQYRLKEARIAALNLQRSIVSNIYDQSKPNKKFKDKSRNRIRKMVKKLKNKIESKFPIVIRDESKVSELHEVRKDTKKLRYLIELVSNSKENRKIDNGAMELNVSKLHNKNSRAILKYLEKIQEMLGDIHDYDITIDHLRGKLISNGLTITSVLTDMQKKRNTKFDQFVNYIRTLAIVVNNTG